jgi:hypothetical protein
VGGWTGQQGSQLLRLLVQANGPGSCNNTPAHRLIQRLQRLLDVPEPRVHGRQAQRGALQRAVTCPGCSLITTRLAAAFFCCRHCCSRWRGVIAGCREVKVAVQVVEGGGGVAVVQRAAGAARQG